MTEPLAALDHFAGSGDAIAAARARATRLARPVLLCVARPLDMAVGGARAPSGDLLAMVAAARAVGAPATFLARGDAMEVAAFGAAWTRTAEGATRIAAAGDPARALLAEAVVDGNAPPLAIAAFGFADTAPRGAVWRGFPAARVLVPRAAIARRDGAAQLLLQVLVPPRADAALVARRLRHGLGRLRAWSAPAARHDGGDATRYETTSLPAPAAWARAVAATTADIAAGRFAKLVLARACALDASRPFACDRAVARLRRAYPACTTFWLGDAAGDVLGATPEVLARVHGGALETAALAGTIARGTSAAADAALGAALCASAKDRHEHAIVVDAIADALRPLCAALDVETAPRLLRLATMQHLLTPIRGRLAAGVHLLDVIARLHPTPAVGGHPRAALATLAAREGLERGWYAGPLGWFDAAGDGEFAVAIRCALVRQRRAMLFAGAGIVAGSDPDAELAETRLKLQPLLAALLEV